MTDAMFLRHVLHTQMSNKLLRTRINILNCWRSCRFEVTKRHIHGSRVKKNRSKVKLRMTFKIFRQCLTKSLSKTRYELVLPSFFTMHRKRLIGSKLWNRDLLFRRVDERNLAEFNNFEVNKSRITNVFGFGIDESSFIWIFESFLENSNLQNYGYVAAKRRRTLWQMLFNVSNILMDWKMIHSAVNTIKLLILSFWTFLLALIRNSFCWVFELIGWLLDMSV